MVITTFNFFAFVAISLVVYFFCIPKKYQWCVLLAASYVFYAFADWRMFGYILFTTFTVYLGGLCISSGKSPTFRKSVITLVIIANFALLAVFKWWNTLANVGNNMLSIYIHSDFKLPLSSLLLPLGISFYTFQAIGYLIDVYRNAIKPERNIAKFALFVSFFPQLIQGPISRHSELAHQLYKSRKFDHVAALHGFQLMLWGLIKKLIIADRLILLNVAVFTDTLQKSGSHILFGLIIYTIWLYMDFSGGVDIARGVGQMFGIIMPQNFMRPFFSTTLPEFWRRFHISLNNWWRDYLFYPIILSKPMTKFSKLIRKNVSASLGKVIGVYITIIIVRVINAMWLGADAMYIANGLYFGVLIVIGMMAAPVFKKLINALHINTESFGWKLFQILRTFLLVCISHVFLAADGVRTGLRALINIVKDFRFTSFFNESLELSEFGRFDALIVITSLLIVLAIEITQEKGVEIRNSLIKQNLAIQWAVLMACLWAVLIFGKYGFGHDPSAFLYMGF